MALYFPGRREVGKKIELELDSGKGRLEYSIFEYWLDNVPGCTIYCGAEANAEIVRTVGLTTKSTETLETAFESSIGVAGLAQLKSSLRKTLGQEVTWTHSVSTKMTFPCKAPECGKYELTIYQLMRELEVSYFRRGSWLFKSDVWDRKWTKTIIEETEKYDAIPDKTEYDERCSCQAKETPGYDGRLCFDFGNLSMRVPYKLTSEGLKVRIAEYVISFSFSDYIWGLRGLDRRLSISVATEVIPAALRFLGGIDGEEAEASVYKYYDPSAPLDLVDKYFDQHAKEAIGVAAAVVITDRRDIHTTPVVEANLAE